ncbi:hypothetical protein N7470_002189 [Penicillium chermesinum]|nr:hypothetical protein N7470_002189 [Penicillium chermesinum]
METGGMDDGTVDAYTETAIDSIQIIWEYYQANLHDPIERTGSTRYLIQSIQALNCMVLRRSETGGTMHPMAVEALSRGLSVLETFAPHLTLAKMALDQLEIPIQEFMGLSCKPTPGHLAEKSFACEEDMTASCVPHGLYEYHAAETSVGDEDWVGDIVDTSTIHSTCNSDNWLYDFLNE